MKKNRIKNIILHIVDDTRINSRMDSINELHAQVIERRLNQSNLTISEKVSVIDQIIDNLKFNEIQDVI